MRFKVFLTIAFIFMLTHAVSSQSNLESYSKRLSGILMLEDANEQKYQLTIFNNEVNDFLHSDIEIDKVKKPFNLTSSDDSKFEILYYVLTKGNNVRYVFFVRYNDNDGNVQVHTFSQKLSPDVRTPGKVKDPVIRISTRVVDGVKFYEISFAADGDPLVWMKYDDLKLKCVFEEIKKTKNDIQKTALNEIALKRLRLLWNSPDYFDDGFPGLSRIKTLFSSDKKIKITTYGISFSDFSNKFYGAVITKDKEGDTKVFELTDRTGAIRSPARMTLPNTKWYGAMYIDIVEKHYQKKTYYTLLGYKGQDEFVKTRVVDVLWFAGSKPRFGAPVFKDDRLTFNRLIYKYSIGANMVLRYDKKKKMIVMDNLEPSDAMYKGVYRFYGPDFTYNGYKFEKGKWVLYRNIDMRNPE